MDFWTILISAAITFVFGMLAYMCQQKMKENKQLKLELEAIKTQHEKAIEDGVVCILRKHLMDEHECWMSKEYITPTALESGIAMYKAYKALGGNGMIDHMDEEIRNLPVRN